MITKNFIFSVIMTLCVCIRELEHDFLINLSHRLVECDQKKSVISYNFNRAIEDLCSISSTCSSTSYVTDSGKYHYLVNSISHYSKVGGLGIGYYWV